MNPLLIGGGVILLLLLLGRKTQADKVSEGSAPAISDLRIGHSVKENLLIATEWASTGGGVGAALGGPIGFVVGTAIGWAVGLIALAIRGGVAMGWEIRKIIFDQYKKLGFPAASADFMIWATYLTATNRAITVCEDGTIQLPFFPNQGHWLGNPVNGTLEAYIDTFWTVLRPSIDSDTRITDELNASIRRNTNTEQAANRYGAISYNESYFPEWFDLSMKPGRWRGVDEGQSLADVPFLKTIDIRLDVNHRRHKVFTGLLKENVPALKAALRWSAVKFGVQNEAWLNDAIETLGG